MTWMTLAVPLRRIELCRGLSGLDTTHDETLFQVSATERQKVHTIFSFAQSYW